MGHVGARRTGRLTASKGVLVRGARVVCNFYATRLADGVVVEVDIGALVEAVVGWLLRRRGHVVVDVGEAVVDLVCGLL